MSLPIAWRSARKKSATFERTHASRALIHCLLSTDHRLNARHVGQDLTVARRNMDCRRPGPRRRPDRFAVDPGAAGSAGADRSGPVWTGADGRSIEFK